MGKIINLGLHIPKTEKIMIVKFYLFLGRNDSQVEQMLAAEWLGNTQL